MSNLKHSTYRFSISKRGTTVVKTFSSKFNGQIQVGTTDNFLILSRLKGISQFLSLIQPGLCTDCLLVNSLISVTRPKLTAY